MRGLSKTVGKAGLLAFRRGEPGGVIRGRPAGAMVPPLMVVKVPAKREQTTLSARRGAEHERPTGGSIGPVAHVCFALGLFGRSRTVGERALAWWWLFLPRRKGCLLCPCGRLSEIVAKSDR